MAKRKTDETKINALLHAQTSENNYLAYLLLQSQLKYSSLEALDYIFQFQIVHIRNANMDYHKFELENYAIHFSSNEELETDYVILINRLTVFIEISLIGEQKHVLREEEFTSSYSGEEKISTQKYIEEYKMCIQRILPQLEKLLSTKS